MIVFLCLSVIAAVVLLFMPFVGKKADDDRRKKLLISIFLFHVVFSLGLLFPTMAKVATTAPEVYSKVENYAHITTDGEVKVIEGPFYKNGDTYYKQDISPNSLAFWIPFVPCDYVEVELPKSAILPEKGTTNLCPNCNSECDSAFCPDCGEKIN